MNEKSLYEQLTEYSHTDAYPLHMPGHKRNTAVYEMENPYGFDITEIDGFDDLHEPEGILRDSMDRAAALYGVEESYYLIGGSTAGILAGISACAAPGDRVLMARNCHKSVYHGVILNQLEPIYLHPHTDPATGIAAGIDPICVETALAGAEKEGRPISLVVLTSPTYEGILSDIQMIAGICHSHGIPLMVDEAHGAHLSAGQIYTSCFPAGACECGADLIVQSLHKTLGAFTQTGILHRQGNLVSGRRVKHFLDIYQTSSPSYVLMAGIDRCIRQMASEEGRCAMGQWAELLREFYAGSRDFQVLRPLTLDSDEHFFAWDPSKLVITIAGSDHTGRELMEILRERYHLELEMASCRYVIAMTGIGDRPEGIRRFLLALGEIDREWAAEERTAAGELPMGSGQEEVIRMLPWRADRLEGEALPMDVSSLGRIALEFVYAYPPGVPILVPGEEVTEGVLDQIRAYEEASITMRGYERQEEHLLRSASAPEQTGKAR